MKKEAILKKINVIIKSNELNPMDIGKIFNAMSEILQFASNELKQNEPYAEIDIKAYSSVSKYLSDVEEFAKGLEF